MSKVFARQVLTLNQSFQPLGTVSVERAMALLYTRRAYVVKFDGEGVIGFPGGSISIPEIIAIPSANFYHQRKPNVSRQNVFKRDQYCCLYCGGAFTPKDLTIDHLYPRSRFQELSRKFNLNFSLNSWQNLVTSCKKCNSKKDCKTLSELGWPDVKPDVPLGDLEIDWDLVMQGVECDVDKNFSGLDISKLWEKSN